MNFTSGPEFKRLQVKRKLLSTDKLLSVLLFHVGVSGYVVCLWLQTLMGKISYCNKSDKRISFCPSPEKEHVKADMYNKATCLLATSSIVYFTGQQWQLFIKTTIKVSGKRLDIISCVGLGCKKELRIHRSAHIAPVGTSLEYQHFSSAGSPGCLLQLHHGLGVGDTFGLS